MSEHDAGPTWGDRIRRWPMVSAAAIAPDRQEALR